MGIGQQKPVCLSADNEICRIHRAAYFAKSGSDVSVVRRVSAKIDVIRTSISRGNPKKRF